ncbi:MAG: type III pantothenate kinase [bacterium]
MLLAIDIGNTSVVFGLFSEKKLVRQWRCLTGNIKIPKISAPITSVIVSSVVPGCNKKLKSEIRDRFGLNSFFVTAENIPELIIKVRSKKEVGADRVVNALAAFSLYKQACIVIDFGTATTFDVVSAKGEYLGGAIAPGIELSREVLHSQTAKLPRVAIKKPKSIIGKDTVSAMQSGLVYGYVAMVEGMMKKLLKAYRPIGLKALRPKVIATGGYSPLICKLTSVVDRIDLDLTLKGLRIIADDI